MIPRSDFLLIGAGAITPKGSMNIANFGKTSLFVEQDYEQQTSTRLWSVRVNKWFKKHFFWDTSILKNLWNFQKFIGIFHCCMTRWLRNKNLGVFIQCQYTRTILKNKKRNDKRFNNRAYSLLFLMAIFLNRLWFISNILKWLDRKIFTKLVTNPFQKQSPGVFCRKRCS